MNSRTNTKILEDVRINVKLKLAGIWTAVTLCYIYADIVGFYQPGAIDGILSGKMGPLGSTTQELLLAVAIFMSTPCAMVFVSIFFKPKINRWLNIIFGIIHTVAMILTMFMGPWTFYLYFGIIEVIFTLLIVWFAWNWPKVIEIKET
ncbi:DUF6326 family protein [Confluentibacter lentus]|uniref:DUF6326 family protein n=1 Tax=Confluentibacter lentus TaxID=1699412 RepID=UPI000C2909A9|nr:DUF6326 family protein [Confluentibacter lentus]